MLSNCRNCICTRPDQWHNSSRDIDAEQFAEIVFVRHADQWHNSSRDIDAEQLQDWVCNTEIWHNSSRDIDAEQFAIGFVKTDQWHNSSRDIDAEQFAELGLFNTQISGTIPREISMLSNLQKLFCQHAYQWHNSSRDIDAEQFAVIVFVQHAD